MPTNPPPSAAARFVEAVPTSVALAFVEAHESLYEAREEHDAAEKLVKARRGVRNAAFDALGIAGDFEYPEDWKDGYAHGFRAAEINGHVMSVEELSRRLNTPAPTPGARGFDVSDLNLEQYAKLHTMFCCAKGDSHGDLKALRSAYEEMRAALAKADALRGEGK